ncbi:MAG: alpha-mannosidase [Thermoprotei archaeon]|nr:alpha-mannosidase [Thermoprotei archaeon]
MPDEVYLVGHAHIDLSWLWTREETIREICPRTFRSVLSLMDKYSLFCYAQSSAQLYEWMEEHYPEIFREIKKRVQEGRWEIVGGAWVEHNANLPCGESLVRQYLFGKRYFLRKFGVDVKVAWLPDSFGFCWTLPQILRKCGIEYFVTHKLKWQIERMRPPIPFPYNLFWWEAPDGSRILAYHTVGSYSEDIRPTRLLRQLEELKEKHGIDKLLVLFGRGDHGGGPTEDMIKDALWLMKRLDFPLVFFSTAKQWFENIRQIAERIKVPVVRDELYVKTHRGTYTTEAKVKYHNRKCECLLLTAERFASIAMILGMKYPQEELNSAWKRLLLNQVHDNLDGTSIEEVYKEAEEDYKEIYKVGYEVLKRALSTIASRVDTSGDGIPIIVFNPLSWSRSDIVELSIRELGNLERFKVIDPYGKEVLVQIVEEGGDKKAIFIARDVPSLGYKVYRVIPSEEPKQAVSTLSVEEYFLENEYLRVEINGESGCLSRVYDKINRREVLDSSGRGNIVQLYEDRPPNAPAGEPAWNMYLGSLVELGKAEEVSVVEKGPVRGIIRVVKRYGKSTFEQYIILYQGIPRVDFLMKVDWHERYRTAKVAFPLSFRNHWATYSIPFGAIQRYQYVYEESPPKQMEMPRRAWEPADRAKFEVPALYWVNMDTEEGDYGVALLNDCKYGFDVVGNTIRMTLLRGPRRGYPYMPRQDQWTDQSDDPRVGIHVIRYALYPHKGDWRRSSVLKKGYEFNYPLIAYVDTKHKGSLPRELSFLEIGENNILLSALKKAEDTDELILRVYEGLGRDGKCHVKLVFRVEKAVRTDLMEEGRYIKEEEIPVEKGAVEFRIGHNEIVTIRMKVKEEAIFR